MRLHTAITCALLAAHSAHAEPEKLSAPDREALIERLEAIRNAAEARLDAKYKVALAAYRAAAVNETTAFDFYMHCTEKVRYEDEDRKSSEFRDWKRKKADAHSDPGFRLALRYQLQWLIMSILVSPDDVDVADYAPKAVALFDSIVADADKLNGHEKTLRQNVFGTVFARAYDIGHVKKEGWPTSPGQIDEIYEDLVFPAYRTPGRVDSLRNAWIKRIQQEITLHEAWSRDNDDNPRPALINPNGRRLGSPDENSDHNKFLEETVPRLQWKMEVDVFKAGDERASAMRMLSHIEKHITHKDSMKWSEEFTKLLTPPGEAPPEPDDEGHPPPPPL